MTNPYSAPLSSHLVTQNTVRPKYRWRLRAGTVLGFVSLVVYLAGLSNYIFVLATNSGLNGLGPGIEAGIEGLFCLLLSTILTLTGALLNRRCLLMLALQIPVFIMLLYFMTI